MKEKSRQRISLSFGVPAEHFSSTIRTEAKAVLGCVPMKTVSPGKERYRHALLLAREYRLSASRIGAGRS
jgi:hypothetical protein